MAEYSKEKLYFLKIPKDFFQGHYMRALEGVPNGKEYELMYLKLMLESTAYNGWLRLSQGIAYSPEMIAGITNTPIDTVRVGLGVLESFGLVSRNGDGSLFLPQVPELTGVTTKGALKKAEQRDRGVDKCLPDVHQDIKSIRELESIDTTTDFANAQSSVRGKEPIEPKEPSQRPSAQVHRHEEDDPWGGFADDILSEYSKAKKGGVKG